MNSTNTTNTELRSIEKKLTEIIADMGHLKGRSTKATKILAYIYIHQEVTQQHLQELTGYSLGTISTALQDLEKTGTVSKTPCPNSHRHLYKANGKLMQALSKSMTEFPTYLTQMKEFLRKTEEKLKKPSLQNKQGYETIKQFTDEMSTLIVAYEHILKKFQTEQHKPQAKRGIHSDC
jgi:DNA-binding transcriptional regulator GbsR (MarR family)